MQRNRVETEKRKRCKKIDDNFETVNSRFYHYKI